MSKKSWAIVLGSVMTAMALFTPKVAAPKDKVYIGKVVSVVEVTQNGKPSSTALVEKDNGQFVEIGLSTTVASYLKKGMRIQGRTGWMFGCEYVDGVVPPDTAPLHMDGLAANE